MVATHNWRSAGASPSQHSTGFLAMSGSGRNDGFIGSGGHGATTAMATGGPAGAGTGTPFIGSASKLTTNGNRPVGSASTTKDANFESLLSTSASLLSNINRTSTLNPYSGQSRDPAEASNSGTTASGALGEKSLLELSVASNFKTSTTTTFESEASAHRMLAREGYGYDSARLGQSTREFEMRTSQSGSHAASVGRMEEEKKDELVPINNDGGFDQATFQALTNLQGTSIKQILNSHHEHWYVRV